MEQPKKEEQSHSGGSMSDNLEERMLVHHRKSWHGFTRFVFLSTAATVIVLLLLALFLL